MDSLVTVGPYIFVVLLPFESIIFIFMRICYLLTSVPLPQLTFYIFTSYHGAIYMYIFTESFNLETSP